MNSPLGVYSQVVAAVVAVGVVGAAVAAHLVGRGDAYLDNLGLLAIGAVFGSAATTNNTKRDLAALHARLDAAGVAGQPVSMP